MIYFMNNVWLCAPAFGGLFAVLNYWSGDPVPILQGILVAGAYALGRRHGRDLLFYMPNAREREAVR